MRLRPRTYGIGPASVKGGGRPDNGQPEETLTSHQLLGVPDALAAALELGVRRRQAGGEVVADRAKAVLAGDRVPERALTVRITARPVRSRVDPETGAVVRNGG
jgi:hypothetical protein